MCWKPLKAPHWLNMRTLHQLRIQFLSSLRLHKSQLFLYSLPVEDRSVCVCSVRERVSDTDDWDKALQRHSHSQSSCWLHCPSFLRCPCCYGNTTWPRVTLWHCTWRKMRASHALRAPVSFVWISLKVCLRKNLKCQGQKHETTIRWNLWVTTVSTVENVHFFDHWLMKP